MRVLTVVDAFRLGGAETLIAQLGRVAPEAGLELDVLSLHGRSTERSPLEPVLIDAGLEPHYLGARRTVDAVAFARLVRYIKRTRPDVVHAHLEMSMTMALPAAALARTPAVGTFHQVFRQLPGRAGTREQLAIEVATRSQGAIFVSDASLRSYADRYRPGRPVPKTWRVVHNGIDLRHFAPAPGPGAARLPADLGLDGARVVTVVAALRDFKGIAHALEAWPAVSMRHPDVRLLVVGTGEEEASLRRQAEELRLGDSVVFAGIRSDVPALVQASEVVLLPSIHGENLPTVLMEAGGCARPVVASDVGGIADIVVHGETGLLTRPGASGEIADALIRLLDDPALGNRLGLAARRRMEQHFDAVRWAENLRQLYLEVGARPGAPAPPPPPQAQTTRPVELLEPNAGPR